MSRETYEEHLRRPGPEVGREFAVYAFGEHRRDCVVCREYEYGYTRCPQGRQLAREVVRARASTP
ncbi:MAG: hypothetical protein ACHQC8_02690 [Solirubrobacterales bacterium]